MQRAVTLCGPTARQEVAIAVAMWALVGALLMSLLVASHAEDCPSGRETAESSTESRLLKDIMCGYSDEIRPVKDHKRAVNVTVGLSLKYLTFDELEEILTVHSWLAMSWVDEYLNWDPQNYGGLREIQIESHKLWQPQLTLYNADANTYSPTTFYTTCIVNSTGLVMCVPHVAHTAICTTKLKNWPFDTQDCTLRFGSWVHKGEQVNFQLNPPVNTDDFTPGPGWKLLKVTGIRSVSIYRDYPNDTYPFLWYYFSLQRLAAGPAAIIVIPSCVVMLLMLASQLLDVKDCTRLCLCCFSLFGHFIFLMEIGYDLPKHSSDTPIILYFLCDSMIINLVAILLTLLLGSMRARADQPYFWIPKINGVFDGGARFAVFTEFEPGLLIEKDGNAADTSAAESRVAASRDWIRFCNICNSLFFIIILVSYICLLFKYLPRRVLAEKDKA